MKVALASNWDIQCGAGEHGRDLLRELEKGFEVVSCPGDLGQLRRDLLLDAEIKVVVVNWHPGRVTVKAEDIQWIKDAGAKVILLPHEYYGESVTDLGADCVVLWEAAGGAKHIPLGISIVKDLLPVGERMVGTAGFPFPWKRMDLSAEIARVHGMKFRLIAPKSDQMNTDAYVERLCERVGSLMELHREWLPREDVIRLLSACTFNVFWFENKDHSDMVGQSGSVRMGLAAGRPIIISKHRKFSELFQYEDELYICGQEQEVWEAVDQILADPELAKKPKRLLHDMSWDRTGQMYRDLIKEVA